MRNDREETPTTSLEQPAEETSASLPPFVEEDTAGGVAKLIAQLTDSSKKDDSMPGQAEDLSTPLKSFEQE